MIQKHSFSSFLPFCLVSLILCSSCIDDQVEDCGNININISFDYSHNILSANSFEQQADQVHLFVFNKADGKLVYQENSGETKPDNDFSFRIKQFKTGKYVFAAYAQEKNSDTTEAGFTISELTEGVSAIDDLNYYLNREQDTSRVRLRNLLIGSSEFEVRNTTETQFVKLNLRKVNRTIRVILISYKGNIDLKARDYEVMISDRAGNGFINYDYSLLKDKAINYRPYYVADKAPDPQETIGTEIISQAAAYELSMWRILEENKPALIIRKAGNENTMLSIDLPWLVSLLRMENQAAWSLQEYLDRQDEYTISLFIDQDNWLQTKIIINGWVISNLPIGI